MPAPAPSFLPPLSLSSVSPVVMPQPEAGGWPCAVSPARVQSQSTVPVEGTSRHLICLPVGSAQLSVACHLGQLHFVFADDFTDVSSPDSPGVASDPDTGFLSL